MEVHPDCFPCFLKQTLIALRLATQDESFQKTVLQNILSDIKQADLSKPPAFTTTFIHRKIRTMLGLDPFHDIKSQYNRKALNLYPSLKEMVGKSPDPLRTSSRLAIGGNVIDFGIFTTVDMEGTIGRALHNSLAVDDYSAFRETIAEADEILYLTDNAGEIVFDRILIETIMLLGKRVKAVVKGSPVINDSTREDAEEAGLTQVCEVMDNGSDAVGTVLDWTSPEFRKTFSDAQLIISKGQANFETLFGSEKNIFFLFQSKCDVLSGELNLPTGSMLLMKS
jgi:damage-control phosphatase, subfamily I